jgi:NhaP-type Na+/H+ and K+/H+ antiporter
MPPDSAHRSGGGSQPSLDLARQRIGAVEHFRRRVLGAFRGSLTAGFLGLGILAGEEGPGGILFRDFHAAYLIGSIALAIILFDGGLRTDPRDVRRALWPSLALATIGVIVKAAIGDRTRFGAVELIVRDMQGDAITQVELEPAPVHRRRFWLQRLPPIAGWFRCARRAAFASRDRPR